MDLQATKKRVEELLRARNHTETLPLMQRFNTVANLLKRNKTSIVPAQMVQYIMNGGETASTTNPGPNNEMQKQTRTSDQPTVAKTSVSKPGSQPHLGEAGQPIKIDNETRRTPDAVKGTTQHSIKKEFKSQQEPVKVDTSPVVKTAVVTTVSFHQPNPYNISNYHAKQLFILNQLKKNYIQNKIDYYYLKPVILLKDLKREQYEEEKIDCITENNKTATLKIKNLNYMKSQPQYRISKQDLLAYVKANNEIPKKQVGEAFLMQIFGKKPLQDLRPSQETHRYKLVSIDHHDFMHLKANYL